MNMKRDINLRLIGLTEGVRLRIGLAAACGLGQTLVGVSRLAFAGAAVAMVFEGHSFSDILPLLIGLIVLPLVRTVFMTAKELISHGTAALMKIKLRRLLYTHLLTLGPGYLQKRRTGDVLINTVDAVEQLETFYGQYLPQLIVSSIAPIFIFIFMAVLDLHSAVIFLFFALLTLFTPTFFRRAIRGTSGWRQQSYSALAAEFVDAVQGLATLKVFGQSEQRGRELGRKAYDLYRATMAVLALNIGASGIANACMALGAATALSWGAIRVSNGTLDLTPLMAVLFLGVEVFRPLRELNQLYHRGLAAMASAIGMFGLLDEQPDVVDPRTNGQAVQLPTVDVPAAANASANGAGTAAALGGPVGTEAYLEPTIRFESVRFAYESGKRPALADVSFDLPAGSSLGLVGPSGAGKSTVVNLLFRFFDPQGGCIRLGGHDLRDLPLDALRAQFALVAQDTYLFHGTVTDNLLLGKPDATREEIEAAARAANAHDFILNLVAGYDTIIGERGQKLSGGQRQRLAIARAILKDAPILILDEATSHVDTESEAVIQEALDRLMENRTTIIIAHRLSTVAKADQIVVLDRGVRVEAGRHQELLAQNGVYARLVAVQARAVEEAAVARADVAALGGFGSDSARQVVQPDAARDAGADEANGVAARQRAKPVEPINLSAWQTGLRLFHLVQTQWRRLVVALGGGLFKEAAIIGLGVASAILASRVATAVAPGALVPLVLGIALAMAFFSWLESFVAHDMAYLLLADMRMALYRRLDPLAPAYLLGRRSGDLASIITSDVELVESFFAHAIAPLIVAVLVPGVALAVLAWVAWPLALVLLPFLVLVALSPNYIGRHTERLGNRLRVQLGEVNAHMTDNVQGLREVVAFSRGPLRVQQVTAQSEALTGLQVAYGRQLGFQHGTIDALQALGGLSVLFAGSYMVSQGQFPAAQLPIATMLAFTCFSPVAEIARVAKELANAFGSGRRIFAIHDEPVAVADGPGVPAETELAPSLRFDHVSFNYGPGEPPALTDVSFSADAGQTIAFVGRSGAGKTTAAHLLMRFWDPQEGRITLDGHDVREFALDDLRSRISLVSQDIYLFNVSIRENLRLGNPQATDAEVEAAAKKACAHDFIMALPDEYETVIGERGTALSGGQRQRLAIARALLKRAALLILDEATSHLDTENERTVRAAIAELMADSTTIVIAHRLSTVRDADRIVVLERGRVAGIGTHEELLRQGGPYAQLIRAQLQVPATPAAAGADIPVPQPA